MFASHRRPKILKAVPYFQDITLGLTWDGLRKVYAMTIAGVYPASVKTISCNWGLKNLLAWSFLSGSSCDSPTASWLSTSADTTPMKRKFVSMSADKGCVYKDVHCSIVSDRTTHYNEQVNYSMSAIGVLCLKAHNYKDDRTARKRKHSALSVHVPREKIPTPLNDPLPIHSSS